MKIIKDQQFGGERPTVPTPRRASSCSAIPTIRQGACGPARNCR